MTQRITARSPLLGTTPPFRCRPTPSAGWVAGLTWPTFFCQDMRRLRHLALGANTAFIACAAMANLWPVLVLHLALVPVNCGA